MRKEFVQLRGNHGLKSLKPILTIQRPLQVLHYQRHLWLNSFFIISTKIYDISSHPTLSILMTKNRFVLTFQQAYKAYENSQHDLQQNSKYRYLKISAYQNMIAVKKYLYHAHVELNPFSLGQILLIYQPTKPLDFS